MNSSSASVDVRCELAYGISVPTSFVFALAPARTEHQEVRDEKLEVSDGEAPEWHELEEGYRTIRLHSARSLRLSYAANVELQPEIDRASELEEVNYKFLPPQVLAYLNPSRYCESDRLGRFAEMEFGSLSPGYSRVAAVCDWVNENLRYVVGSTGPSSSACDVLTQRAGVCRDYAHVSIAFLRALGVPARYVSGYAVGLQPPDFHGFLEAFLGNRWYMFDATRMAPLTGVVRIGIGRDAADVPFASIVGSATLQSLKVEAFARRSDLGTESAKAAVSTA